MKTIIIGAGAISYCHANALKDLGIEIYGVFDVDSSKSEQFADSQKCKKISHIADEIHHVDMVHICTPPSFRKEYAEVAANAGCHIMMEKPMSITVEDGQFLKDLAQQYNVKFMVDFNHRFRTGFQKLLDIVRSGELGDVFNVFVHRIGMLGGNAGTQHDTWRKNAKTVCGMSIESLSHDIDMIHQLAGPINSVKADTLGTIPGVPRFDNNANVLFELNNDAMGLIHSSWASHLKGSMRGVIGSKGSAILEGGDLFDFTRLRIKTEKMPYEQKIMINDVYNFASCPSYYRANKHFIDCINNHIETDASADYALSTLKVSHAILDSAEQKKSITL